jgi:hypothetical protein
MEPKRRAEGSPGCVIDGAINGVIDCAINCEIHGEILCSQLTTN